MAYRIERGRWRNEQWKEDSRRMTRARSNDDERKLFATLARTGKNQFLIFLFFK